MSKKSKKQLIAEQKLINLINKKKQPKQGTIFYDTNSRILYAYIVNDWVEIHKK